MPSTCWKHHKGEKERWFSCLRVRSCQLSWPSNSVFWNSSVDVTAKDKTDNSRSEHCLYSCPVYRIKQVQCFCRGVGEHFWLDFRDDAELCIDFQQASIISHISPLLILSVLYQQVTIRFSRPAFLCMPPLSQSISGTPRDLWVCAVNEKLSILPGSKDMEGCKKWGLNVFSEVLLHEWSCQGAWLEFVMQSESQKSE